MSQAHGTCWVESNKARKLVFFAHSSTGTHGSESNCLPLRGRNGFHRDPDNLVGMAMSLKPIR